MWKKASYFKSRDEIVILDYFFQFVAHPNVQQLLASIWYDGLPGFRQMNMILQFLEVCRIGLLFPFFSLAYIICPWASWSQKLRKPFIKFICTSFSYFTFLCKYFPLLLTLLLYLCIPKGSSQKCFSTTIIHLLPPRIIKAIHRISYIRESQSNF